MSHSNYFVAAFCPPWQNRHHPKAAFLQKCQHECQACHRFYFFLSASTQRTLFLRAIMTFSLSLFLLVSHFPLQFFGHFGTKRFLFPLKPSSTWTQHSLLLQHCQNKVLSVTSDIFFRDTHIPKKQTNANLFVSNTEVCWERSVPQWS